jgi:hypothetical protein
MFQVDLRVRVYLLRVFFEAGRADDAVRIIKSLVDSDYTFQNDERHLIVGVWQSCVTPLRMAVLNIRDAPHPNANLSVAADTIQADLRRRLSEMIGIIGGHLLPRTGDDEVRAFYLKALADFQRYQLDCVERAAIPTLASESRQNYAKAVELLKVLPQPRVELLMSAQLNFAILLADYLDQKKKALEMLTQSHHDLSVSLEKYPEERRAKLRDIITLMSENIDRWKPLDTT